MYSVKPLFNLNILNILCCLSNGLWSHFIFFRMWVSIQSWERSLKWNQNHNIYVIQMGGPFHFKMPSVVILVLYLFCRLYTVLLPPNLLVLTIYVLVPWTLFLISMPLTVKKSKSENMMACQNHSAEVVITVPNIWFSENETLANPWHHCAGTHTHTHQVWHDCGTYMPTK